MFKLLEVANQVDFYSDGFFGYGEKGDFKYFSLAHIIPILLLIIAIILTFIFREKIKNFKGEKIIRHILAWVMLLAEMGYFWRLLYAGTGDPNSHTLLDRLPLQVCEWTCIFAVFMVLLENKTYFDINVFVCLTLGIVPLFTPAVIYTTGPKYFRYYQFWLEHAVPTYCVFYMMFIKGFRMDIRKIYKPIIFLSILAIFAVILNNLIPTANYLYLSDSTDGASIANILPKSIPLRIVIYAVLIGILFILEYLINLLIIKLYNKKHLKEEKLENDNPQM